jgi:hypothetical protein
VDDGWRERAAPRAEHDDFDFFHEDSKVPTERGLQPACPWQSNQDKKKRDDLQDKRVAQTKEWYPQGGWAK